MVDFLQELIENKQSDIETKPAFWKEDSKLIAMRKMQVDNRGEIGETLVCKVLIQLGHNVQHTQTTNPQQKQWDLVVDGITWEVKTATMGQSTPSFQHENVYKERNYDGIIFVDIAPDEIYISFIPKHIIVWKNLHRRKDSNFYKWDWTLKKIQDKKMTTVDDFAEGYNAAVKSINEHKLQQPNPHSI